MTKNAQEEREKKRANRRGGNADRNKKEDAKQAPTNSPKANWHKEK